MSVYANELFTPRAAHADEFATVAQETMRGLPDRARVLDVGCGSGDLIRRAIRPGISFVGVDISRPNIEAAQTACPDAKFYCDDFLTFDAGEFDVVIANSILHLIDCPDSTLTATLSRSLKPGGSLIAAMPAESAKNRLLSFQRRVWRMLPKQIDRLLAATLKDASIAERLVYLSVPPTRLMGRFSKAMDQAGFSLISSQRMHAEHPLKLQHVIATWRRY